MKLQAVLVDMDGTLFDSERLYLDVWKMAEKEFGFTGSEVILARFTGAQPENAQEMVVEFFGGDAELARRVTDFRHRKVTELRLAEPVPVKPGARELLAFLREKRIPTALATSSDMPWAEYLFGTAGLPLCFDALVTKEKITRTKPDPQIFLLAAEELGVPIENCLVVEDSVNGIRAAAASGAKSVWVPDVPPPAAEQAELRRIADAVVPSLHEVRDLAARWWAGGEA